MLKRVNRRVNNSTKVFYYSFLENPGCLQKSRCVEFQFSVRRSIKFISLPSQSCSLFLFTFILGRYKCTKNYNACTELLFCSLNLLFDDVFVAVVVVVCLLLKVPNGPHNSDW